MTSKIHPLTCGFAKIAAYNALNIKVNRRVDECLKVYTSRNYKYQHKQFQNQFQIENNNNFEMTYGLFVSKSLQKKCTNKKAYN